MKLNFPSYATTILNTIESYGYEAWFVGGCVRDSVIGRHFFDIDITTNALPDDIERIFSHTIPTGKKHGTITVLVDKNTVEVTTYRSDSDYLDNRHPTEVIFQNDIKNDLSRRDFTINALAYHPERGILDLFNGISDLENGIIRAVGDAKSRFEEDALRILRAFRFASVLNFEIEASTLAAALSCKERISSLSGERILAEMKKLISGKKPYVITELFNSGALKYFGIGAIKNEIPQICKISEDYKTAFFIFLCNFDITKIKQRLKPENKLINNINILIKISTFSIPENKSDLKLILNKTEGYNELYIEYAKLFFSEKDFINTCNFLREINDNNEPYLIGHLRINGYDLEKLGIKGKEIKETLDFLIKEVIYEPRLNTVARLKRIINK